MIEQMRPRGIEQADGLEGSQEKFAAALQEFKTSAETLLQKSETTENVDPATQQLVSEIRDGVRINNMFTALGALTAGAAGTMALQDIWNLPESSFKPYLIALVGTLVVAKTLIWSANTKDHLDNALGRLSRKGVKA